MKDSSFCIMAVVAAFVLTASVASYAQSSDQNFPTPITANEIRGIVKARDIGDDRVTTYYYAFDGEQGDIFINAQFKNFDGDIDVFAVDGMRPMARIVLYADAGLTETGRLVYLRKPEKLLLRIEGRTPNDDQATFVIKFAGSFVALKPSKGDETQLPTANVTPPTRERVNSVGTIIDSGKKPKKPKPSPTPVTTTTTATSDAAAQASNTQSPPAAVVDRSDNLRVVVTLRSGRVVAHQMNDLVRFTVDQGVLVMIAKNGLVIRFSMSDVARVVIE